MLQRIPVILLICASLCSAAQQNSRSKINVGIEQDLLPNATGGYFAGMWAGKDHIRLRALTARVHKPDFLIANGFTNNWVNAYAVLVYYFLKKDWTGWWAGSGLVFWKSCIQSDKKLETAHYKTWLLNGSIGYNIKLYRKFYVSPWCALHLKIAVDKHVSVDERTFSPPFINPEASVKLGVYF